MAIHGTEDKYASWEGRKTPGEEELASVPNTIQGWVRRNGCPAEPQTSQVTDRISLDIFGPCQSGTEVRLYAVQAGGHTWPGGDHTLPPSVIGETVQDWNASEAIWQFFSQRLLQ
jgi:polyhydroxybutyrate depolymerase